MISPATHDVLFCYWVQWFSGLYQAQCGKDDVLVVTGHFTGDHVLFHLDTVFFTGSIQFPSTMGHPGHHPSQKRPDRPEA